MSSRKPPGWRIRELTGKLPGHKSHKSGTARWVRVYRDRQHKLEMKELKP